MVESFMEKRVIFPSGGQRRFLYRVKDILNFSWEEIANLLQISSRALTDWKREKFSMSYGALKLLSKKSKITKPHDIKIESPFWYVSKGARKGGLVVYKKYGHIGGDQEFRKKKWREWWEREGKYKNNLIANLSLPIKKPRKSKELAEFVGIILGDGGISQYQITITFHSKHLMENLIKFH